MGQHDRSYRHLFTHPRMVAALLRDILGLGVTGPVDLATLERVHDSYVTARQQVRYSDLVWRLRRPDGRLLYVLLELQSTPETFMAVRVLTYVSLLWEDLIRRRDLVSPRKVPEILAVVVYTGRRPWRAPLDVRGLIDAAPGRPQPRLLYRLVDPNRFDLERLWGLRSPISALFLLERRLAPAEIGQAIGLLVESLASPEDAELRRAFMIWLRRVMLPGRDLDEEQIPTLLDLEDFQSMLEDNVRRWEKQLRKEVRKEALEEGRSSGQREGEAALLLRQLELKFGPVDESTRTRVRRASSERRMLWAGRILSATTLAEVFRASPARRAS
jgi:predicted transposase YdaD